GIVVQLLVLVAILGAEVEAAVAIEILAGIELAVVVLVLVDPIEVAVAVLVLAIHALTAARGREAAVVVEILVENHGWGHPFGAPRVADAHLQVAVVVAAVLPVVEETVGDVVLVDVVDAVTVVILARVALECRRKTVAVDGRIEEAILIRVGSEVGDEVGLAL